MRFRAIVHAQPGGHRRTITASTAVASGHGGGRRRGQESLHRAARHRDGSDDARFHLIVRRGLGDVRHVAEAFERLRPGPASVGTLPTIHHEHRSGSNQHWMAAHIRWPRPVPECAASSNPNGTNPLIRCMAADRGDRQSSGRIFALSQISATHTGRQSASARTTPAALRPERGTAARATCRTTQSTRCPSDRQHRRRERDVRIGGTVDLTAPLCVKRQRSERKPSR